MESDLRYPKVHGAGQFPYAFDVPSLITLFVKGYRLIQQVGGGGFSTCVCLQKAKKGERWMIFYS
jgi:hypothetical protein